VGDFVMIVNEQIVNECRENAPEGVDRGRDGRGYALQRLEFQRSGGERQFLLPRGRFGAHSAERKPAADVREAAGVRRLVHAGVRAIDIRDPYQPKEVGYYIPAKTGKTDKRCVKMPDGAERCKVAIQTNNLEVDDRWLHLHRRSREHRHAHPAAHRRGAPRSRISRMAKSVLGATSMRRSTTSAAALAISARS